MKSTLKHTILRGLLLTAYIISLALQPFTASDASAATTTLPVLWTAGGLSAGNNSAGQAARVATDTSGNIAIVSGPAFARSLSVTSYTAAGTLRWQQTVSPGSGTFLGNWVAAAPNGDFVAVGTNIDSRGTVIGVTMVRYASDGTFQWRVDSTGAILSVGRLLVDAGGNAYLSYNSTLHKYSPAGALLWSTSTSVPDGGAALSPDGAELVLTGTPRGGSNWVTGSFDTATGNRRWLVTAAEGISAADVILDGGRVYVTGQGYTGAGTPSLTYFLTVVAYDRATGTRLWRTDKKPADAGNAAGLRIAKAPDGSLVVTGQALRGFLDWYTVALETTGTVRWEAVRDGGLNTDEIPARVLTLTDGTTVVTGRGGPNLPGGYIQGVTAGYGLDGTLLWEAFSRMETIWATALPNGDVCATGGYDALITCWRPSGNVTPPPTPDPTAVPPSPTNTPVSSLSSGFLSPSANAAQTSNAGDNNGYQTSPANAYANDSVVATDTNSGTNISTSCTNTGKDKHIYTTYNFNIPATAVIQGLQVRLDGRADATSGSPKICIQLSGDGGATWTTAKATATLSTTEVTYTLGSASDIWGYPWTSSNFSNANFRVRVIDVASNTNRDFFLDYVAVNVTYQP